MARMRTKGKYTSIGVGKDITGWLEFAAREEHSGMSGYLDRLMREDRAKRLEDADTADRYRKYLDALGMDEELASLDGGAA
jgi:hypothetical protein